ncbi:MAG: hypothetical protein ACREN5_02725 [Gemmatimonadales bacterium]
MRRFLWTIFPLALALPSVGAAQRGAMPTLVFTIFGGYYTGHPLWTVDKQPLCVQATGACTPERDTIALSRSVSGGLSAGLSATYYHSPHLGVQFQLALISLALEGGCDSVFMNPDAEEKNLQACQYFSSTSSPMSGISGLIGVTFRAASRGAISPYVRASVGFFSYARSTIESQGVFFFSNGNGAVKSFIIDDDPKRGSFSASAGLGFTLQLSPGYLFRLEVSDVVATMERAAGPANAAGQASTDTRTYHHFGLTMGVGVVLERQRGRRY